MRTAGFINPNIFALKGLEYRIRFCRAPNLVATREALRRDHLFNSYLLRGEYDLALVSVESDQLLFQALLRRRLDEFGVTDVSTFTVGAFLKYHGCPVTPIRGGANPADYPNETFHHLFNLAKDWDSAPESWKATLLHSNLLMVDGSGSPTETTNVPGEGTGRRTIVRLGFHPPTLDMAPSGFEPFLVEQIVSNGLVRNCYEAKPPARPAYVLELVGTAGSVDRFVAGLHDDCSSRFPGVAPVARCDEVVTRLAEGRLNVLLTMQARPEAVALAEDRLSRSFFEEDRTGMMRFVDESEAIIRGIRAEALQSRCLSMLSTMQLAFHLDTPAALRDALRTVAREVVALMIERLAATLGCPADEDAVLAELKRRKLFRDHAATIGSLSPTFLNLCTPARSVTAADSARAFDALIDLSNRMMLSGQTSDRVSLAPEERAEAEDAFYRLMRAVPEYFGATAYD